MNATWTAVTAQVAARGQDPLTALLAESDEAVAHLIGRPIVRGGTMLLHDPLLCSTETAQAAAHQHAYGKAVVATPSPPRGLGCCVAASATQNAPSSPNPSSRRSADTR
jgi:hypothetical protein